MAEIPDDNQGNIFFNGVGMAGISDDEPIGKALDEHTIDFVLKFEHDPNPFDVESLPGVIYYSDEPRQILDELPGWLRRAVIAYGRFRLRRKK